MLISNVYYHPSAKGKRKRNKKKNRKREGFYWSDEWRSVRYKALLKHGKRCQCCGATNESAQLHVDHIKPRSRYPELELRLDNLQVLCEDCNKGKGAWDDTDHRSTRG